MRNRCPRHTVVIEWGRHENHCLSKFLVFWCLYQLVFDLETIGIIWWLIFEKKPFQFWQYIWIQVLNSYLIMYNCKRHNKRRKKKYTGLRNCSHIANIFNVIFTLFMCVPLSTVIPLYCLHIITAPSAVEKCKNWFTVVCCSTYTSTK